jgi:hypothetical protein
MACPYFRAVKPRRQTDRSRSSMLPLGDAWDGDCLAIPDSPCEPDEITLLSYCNMGYARGCCARFPNGDGPDAARFTIAADGPETLRVYYVLERNHHPWAHGPLEFAVSPATAPCGHGSERPSDTGTAVANQSVSEATLGLARAYVESYLRRISEASGH